MRGEGHGGAEDVVLPPEPHLLQQDDVKVAARENLPEGAKPGLVVEAERPVEAPHVQVEHPQAQLRVRSHRTHARLEGCNAERTLYESFRNGGQCTSAVHVKGSERFLLSGQGGREGGREGVDWREGRSRFQFKPISPAELCNTVS